jgi:hypothetical protein
VDDALLEAAYVEMTVDGQMVDRRFVEVVERSGAGGTGGRMI